MMQKILAVALGGSIGAVLRYLIYVFINKSSNSNFPWATIAVNLAGSFIIGLLWGFFEKFHITAGLRLFIFVGILGSFTTFSTFAFDAFTMMKSGDFKSMIAYVLITNVIGILLAIAGYQLTKLN